MRPYEQSHPWITFDVNLERATPFLWLLLGEAQSKCDHIKGVPLLPAVASKLHELYLAKGVLATTAIEGNTLTEEEVLRRLERKLQLPPSKEYLGREIDNIVEACTAIAQGLFAGGSTLLSVDDILRFNRLVLRDLPVAEEVQPGQIRAYNVGVGRYPGAPYDDCMYLLERLSSWLNNEFTSPAGYTVAFGILKAIIAHLYLAWIHPFGDGNGRTARLVEFHICLASGVPSAAAHLLSNHYNQTRAEYYRQLDTASKSGGNLFPFIHYALQGFVDGLRSQIDAIESQQLRVLWDRHIYNRFRDRRTTTDRRRRDLMFAISSHYFETNTSRPFQEIRSLTPKLAIAYHDKTDKTIRRDLIMLGEMDLLEEVGKTYRPKLDKMHAFMSPALPVEGGLL